MATVSIPTSITSIGAGAFSGCSNLSAVYITDLTAWCNIDFLGGNPLEYAKDLYLNRTKVTALEIPSGITEIKRSVFQGCSATSVTIPSNVTSIGSSAFYGCSNLVSVTVPSGVTDIGRFAFAYCKGLTEINFNAADVTPEESGVFAYAGQDASGITLNIGAAVTQIPGDLFRFDYDSTFTAKITSVVFAAGSVCRKIGADAFRGCGSLSGVYISDLAAWCKIDFELTYDYHFGACYSNPLYNAKNLYLSGNKVTALEIPNGVTEIKPYAFMGCNATSVKIPASITKIGNYAFDGCQDLTAVHITDLEAWCKIDFESDSYSSYSNPLYYANYLYLNGNKITDLVIPESITEIKPYTFAYCGLLSATLPSGVQKISADAFYGLADSCYTIYQNGKYLGTATNPHLYLAGVTDYAITSFEISASTKFIGDGAFAYCGNLEAIVIPSGVTSIGDNAFSGCSSLASVSLPASVTSIGSSAFSGIDSDAYTVYNGGYYLGNDDNPHLYLSFGLEDIAVFKIHSETKLIGDHAFYSDGGRCLSAVVIPASVVLIGENAFRGVVLEAVYYCGSESDWENIEISEDGDYGNAQLNNATRYYYSENPPTVAGNWWHYVDDVPTVWPAVTG